jgi:sulfoquinovosyltransferase
MFRNRNFLSLTIISILLSCHALLTRTTSKINHRTHLSAGNEAPLPIDHEKPLRILLIVEPTPFGYVSGYANRFKEMLKYLKQAGDTVSVITPDPQPNPPADYLDYPIKTLRGFEFPLYPQVTLSFDMKLSIGAAIKEFKPDIIHCASPSCIMNPTIAWARHLDIPLLFSYHTDLPSYAKAYGSFLVGEKAIVWFSYTMMKLYHGQADLILATSPQLKEDMETVGVRRVDVWQKGVNTEIFNPRFKSEAVRERISEGNPSDPLLLYVGRLGAEKKVHRLRKVLEANPTARLVIVGKGPAEEEIKEYFKGYRAHFTGQIIGEELSAIYASVDMFVMPSDSETLGFVVIEALASGVPAVGVAAGGLVDIIQNGVTGYLADNNDDMVHFSERVKSMIDNPESRVEMAAKSFDWAQGISWEAATSKLRNKQYRKAIALHRARDDSGRHMQDVEDAIMSNM